MDKNRFIELLTKKNAGELSLQEQLELSKLMETDAENCSLATVFEQIFEDPLHYDDIHKKHAEKAWDKVKIATNSDAVPIKPKQKSLLRRLKPSLAAAAIVLLAGLGIVYFTWQHSDAKLNIVATKSGSKSNLSLPDGTQVWLNAESRISYNENFGKGTRDLTLTGEAFFDVVKDAAQPFIIHTETMDIKVLGTAFNVKAYPGEAYTQTSLLRGAIEVMLKKQDNNKIITLKPNEKLTVQNSYITGKDNPQSGNSDEEEVVITLLKKMDQADVVETEWVKNRLAFKSETLFNLAVLLERWYGVTVIITDDSLKNNEYSGSFSGENITEVMEALKLTGEFNYTMHKDTLTIYP